MHKIWRFLRYAIKLIIKLIELTFPLKFVSNKRIKFSLNLKILNQDSSERAAQVDAASAEIVEFLIKLIQRCHSELPFSVLILFLF